MGRSGRRGAAILFATAGMVLVLDRLTKTWAERTLEGEPPLEIVPGLLRLRFTSNPGGAFSILGSLPWLFVAAAITASFVIIAVSFRRRPRLQSVALGLILGGALGNLIDRALRGPGLTGEVVDFVDLHIGTAFSWPVFNVADSAIVVGGILLVITSVLEARRSDSDAAEGPTAEPRTDETPSDHRRGIRP